MAPDVSALRQRVLESGTHHLTRWRDRSAIRPESSSRLALPSSVWPLPRPTTVVSSIIEWSRYSGGAPTLAAHTIHPRTVSGGVLLDSPDQLTLVHVSSARALDAVWSLIERGALISRASPVDTNRGDWRSI